MGGNTFPELHTIRYNKDQYLTLKELIISKFSEMFKKLNDTIVLPSKTSFGDIDMLFQTTKPIDWELIKHELGSSVELHNGPFHSFAYQDEFQVDFIEVKYWEWENFLMSYGGLFNLLGPKFKHLSMKMTNNGIFFVLRDDKGDQYSTIKLTDDFSKIMEFIELDQERFQEGFSNEEELAEYIRNSPFFELIDYEHSNCKIKRNLIRPIQKQCIEIVKKQVEDNLITLKKFTMTEEEIFRFFGVYDQYLKEKEQVELRKLFKSRFNARIIEELTGKIGKELGHITNKIKETPGFYQFVISHTKEEVREKIVEMLSIM